MYPKEGSMNAAFKQLSDSLKTLEASVDATTTETRTAFEISGNARNVAGLDKFLIKMSIRSLYQLIDERMPEDPNSALDTYVVGLAARIALMQAHTVPQLFNGGNGLHAIPAVMNTLEGMRQWLGLALPDRSALEPNSVPYKLAKRARQMTAVLDSVDVDRDVLSRRLEEIRQAHEAAESLPLDLQQLKAATARVQTLSTEAAEAATGISDSNRSASDVLSAMGLLHERAAQLVANCEEAYSITTTKGLAAAFDQRASRLAASMWVWVVGLIIALVAAAWIGADRVAVLSRSIAEADPKWGAVLLNLLLSVVSVGAPLWFAWVATKQLNYRFRLAEDYGFKSSVAKAYQGYRREAALFEENFGARLFDIALLRLEEPPLRLLAETAHGSPWHELADHEAVKKALHTVPGFAAAILEQAKSALSTKFKSSTEPAESAGSAIPPAK
ncbi:hypothetical protein HK414_19630 [Ramlibacter terrae]|uniref:Uncharacterized protein n=1 Tax=Ramlibacter terrae TaxID=2732511 RepID=A0ABX6P5J3_9BURK|nr:hypothetical protein HK414_19630 [Ramlibacter terrae]